MSNSSIDALSLQSQVKGWTISRYEMMKGKQESFNQYGQIWMQHRFTWYIDMNLYEHVTIFSAIR